MRVTLTKTQITAGIAAIAIIGGGFAYANQPTTPISSVLKTTEAPETSATPLPTEEPVTEAPTKSEAKKGDTTVVQDVKVQNKPKATVVPSLSPTPLPVKRVSVEKSEKLDNGPGWTFMCTYNLSNGQTETVEGLVTSTKDITLGGCPL